MTERASVASDALALPARGLRFATSPVDLGGLSPALVGVVLGALVGVVVFIGVVVVVAMRGRKRAVTSSASAHALSDEVVVIPPYTTAQPADPFATAASGARPSRAPSFAPTSELSARALSRMGYDVDASAAALAPAPVQEWVAAAPSSASFPPPSASSIPVMVGASSSELLSSDLLVDDESGPAPRVEAPKAPETQPIVGAPVVVVGPPVVTVGGEAMEIPPPPSGPVSRPHPLSVLAKLPALTAQRAAAPTGASVADLELDDCPTEIAETIFDEPPQPLRRGSRPKIRRVDPVAPRFSTPRPAAGRPASEPPPAVSSRPPPRHSGIVYSPDDAGPTEVFLVRKVSRPA